LENVRWEDVKVNGKIKMDHTETACDVDKLMAAAQKLCQFAQNL
jgi:metal-sulfur cluster biosynthetic enzyme